MSRALRQVRRADGGKTRTTNLDPDQVPKDLSERQKQERNVAVYHGPTERARRHWRAIMGQKEFTDEPWVNERLPRGYSKDDE